MGSEHRHRSDPAGALQSLPRSSTPQEYPVTKNPDVQPPQDSVNCQGSIAEDEWESVPRQWELADFKPIKKLYRGYASKVYLAEDCGKDQKKNAAGEVVSTPCASRKIVLKVYDLLRLSPLTKYQLHREVRLHSSMQHKHIIRLVAAFTQVCIHFSVRCNPFSCCSCGFRSSMGPRARGQGTCLQQNSVFSTNIQWPSSPLCLCV
jgi:hypothetical protein